jgi:hypothetical protein
MVECVGRGGEGGGGGGNKDVRCFRTNISSAMSSPGISERFVHFYEDFSILISFLFNLFKLLVHNIRLF